jgi:stress-induced morphogen
MRSARRLMANAAASASAAGPVERALAAALTRALSPTHLAIENESSKHAGGAGRESHFKVLVVSAAFDGKPPLARHRMVHAAVADAGGAGAAAALPVHALSISAVTPAQFAAGAGLHATPDCRGGGGARADR